MCPRSHKECKTGIWGRFGWSPCPMGAQIHLLSSSLGLPVFWVLTVVIVDLAAKVSSWLGKQLFLTFLREVPVWSGFCFSPLLPNSSRRKPDPIQFKTKKKKKCLLKIHKVQKNAKWKVSFSPTHRLCWLISQVSFQANTRNICVYICVSFFSFPLHKWYLVWWGDSHYRLWRQSLWV